MLLRGTWEGTASLWRAAPSIRPLVGAAQNVVLFLPFGFLLRAAYPRMRAGRILLLGLLLSFFIEVCQMVFRLGWFEVDDLLHNAAGTLAGVLLCRFALRRQMDGIP